MENPTLVIYDSTGRVWGLYSGVTTVPAGVQGVIVDAPESFAGVSLAIGEDGTATVTFEPTQEERNAAQLAYTAMMTDTLITEG